MGVVGQALLALAFPGFAGQEVTVPRLFPFQPAAGRAPETFGRTPVGL